ncbi:MAG: flagellar basal body-associated FliL family protein [Tabrizicola sp.]|uniref:flagellar basal body-associated FliL family protein n=1 Tax=Tabrizicola sp. TaxID=2005166 RepID=UPI002735F901|nr:flagellar basal body-associated FliL family protein [Tabrizicola sp.]MDP3262496.1 flagellar basal body-associated FliL family protein [Tabrizicola sp.]MDP3648484.1 flagellar basal body-associated FliL family protein [Paracoccaceae bacterium]MDZ4065914.1 flagellar basal body-associated FliL family protein [Tabrizicola sp.]
MATADATLNDLPKPRRKRGLLIGVLSAVVLGAGGFYATWSGMILGGAEQHAEVSGPEPLIGIAFVPLETMVVSLGPDAASSHLRFSAQVEVVDSAVADVTLLSPRILDVLNSYLRAIDPAAIEDPSAMAKLRAQMLRRIQIVTGEGRVRDLLITEFVLN